MAPFLVYSMFMLSYTEKCWSRLCLLSYVELVIVSNNSEYFHMPALIIKNLQEDVFGT